MKEIIVKRMKIVGTNKIIYQPVLTMVDETGIPCFTPQEGMKLGMIVKKDFDEDESLINFEGAEFLPITDKTYEKLYELMDVVQVQLTKAKMSIKPKAKILVNTYKNIENQLNTILPFGHSHKDIDIDELVELIVCEHIQGKQTEVCLDEDENICNVDTSLLEEDSTDNDKDYDDYEDDDEEKI